ncbi:hypothetical protein TFLX_05421 [Thermoflexales bacterium]|nr:hypothetical protein TFLX_05421 [Thermoflexales bacterium]
MNTSVSRIVVIGLLFLFTFVFGIGLSNSGKPYNSALFNIHKLIALGVVIFTAVTVYHLRGDVEIRTLVLGAIAITGLLFLALFVSGALLSIGKPDHAAILLIHRIAPLLAVIATALTLYLLASSKT